MNTPRSLAIALGALLASAAACKTDKPAATTAPAPAADQAAAPAAAAPRPARPALADQPAGADGSGGEERRHRGARLDKDGDGVVSDAERAQAMHDRAVSLHQRLDSDGDGKLSPAELASAHGRMHFDDPAALDTNKDGDISADELEAGFKARLEQRRAQHAAAAAGSDQP